MRLLDKVKKITYTAFAVLAIGAVTASGVDVQAKTVNQPTHKSKKVYTVGDKDNYSLYDATNLKINGKNYSKAKKKVKTIQTAKNEQAYKSYTGSYTNYLDDSVVYDTEDNLQQKENYKYISTYDYSFVFLKAGTYKISYDKYESGDDIVEKSQDGKTETVTKVLEKTHYEDTIKVVDTTNPIKKLSLGKSSVSYTVKKSGTKTTTKTVVKNRYLTGKNGKLTFSMNSGYKLTSAYVVTRNAEGNIVVSSTGNKKNVTYSVGKYTNNETYDKIVQDPVTGKDQYVVDEKGYSTLVKAPVVVSEAANKYKETTIVYGYKDSFTGNYTNYSIGQKIVYIPNRDKDGELMYQKDADGKYIRDEKGDRLPVVTTVQATTIVTTYPTQKRVDGQYKTVERVYETVILPTDKTLYDGSEYWRDAKGKADTRYSGDYHEVSLAGVVRTVMLANGSYVTNPEYLRKFYSSSYAGKWQVYDASMDTNKVKYYDNDDYYDIDLNTGEKTTRYVYVYDLDADGDRIPNHENLNVISLGGAGGTCTFKAK